MITKLKIILILIYLSVIPNIIYTSNFDSQECGDAIYRHGGGGHGHNAIFLYYKNNGEDFEDDENYYVVSSYPQNVHDKNQEDATDSRWPQGKFK